MLTISAILMGRIEYDKLPAEQKANVKALHSALFDLETAYIAAGGKAFKVSSGYRSPAQNAATGGAKLSAHMTCKACDFYDPDGAIDAFATSHQDLLAKLGLWQEHPDATKNWAHFDVSNRPMLNRPGCGKRQFRP